MYLLEEQVFSREDRIPLERQVLFGAAVASVFCCHREELRAAALRLPDSVPLQRASLFPVGPSDDWEGARLDPRFLVLMEHIERNEAA